MKSPQRKVYRFVAAETFWRRFYALNTHQKELVRSAWAKFKINPFDPSLNTHKIQSLSARRGEAIWSVTIEGDLRAVFCIRGDTVYTVDIGSHDIYGRG